MTKTAATVSRFCLFTCLLDETRKVPLCISHGWGRWRTGKKLLYGCTSARGSCQGPGPEGDTAVPKLKKDPAVRTEKSKKAPLLERDPMPDLQEMHPTSERNKKQDVRWQCLKWVGRPKLGHLVMTKMAAPRVAHVVEVATPISTFSIARKVLNLIHVEKWKPADKQNSQSISSRHCQPRRNSQRKNKQNNEGHSQVKESSHWEAELRSFTYSLPITERSRKNVFPVGKAEKCTDCPVWEHPARNRKMDPDWTALGLPHRNGLGFLPDCSE